MIAFTILLQREVIGLSLASLGSNLLVFHTEVAPQFSGRVFQALLMHYLHRLCHRHTPPHVANILADQLSLLPWKHLQPDLQLMDALTTVRTLQIGKQQMVKNSST